MLSKPAIKLLRDSLLHSDTVAPRGDLGANASVLRRTNLGQTGGHLFEEGWLLGSTGTNLDAIGPAFAGPVSVNHAAQSRAALAVTSLPVTGDAPLTLTGTNSTAMVEAAGTLQVAGPDAGSVTFGGTTGTLILDDSAAFTGQIFNLTGDGNPSSSDQIDLKDIGFGSATTVSYAGNSSGGTLTVGDGQNHTASLTLAGDYTSSSFTLSSDGHGGTIVIDPPIAGDGSANAPAGAPELPNILNGYAVRPSWEVAGVDYAVGIPSGTSLSSPTTINNPNVSVNLANHHVTVTGNNVTLSGIDFSLNGGWQLILNGVTGTTIQNCNFAIGANAQPMINGDIGGTNNTTITNSVFNAKGLYDNFNGGDINIQGNVTATYNLIENSAADLWDQGGSGSTVQNLTLKYNVFANSGQGAFPHSDQLQLGGGTYTVDVEYNTYYQSILGPANGTQGIFPDIADANGTVVVGSNTISNNTIIALAGTKVNFAVAAQAASGAGNTISINNNYFDPSGDGSVFKYTSTNNTQTNNINMVTGALLGQTGGGSGPSVTSVATSGTGIAGGTADLTTGKLVTLTLNLSGVVTVAGGTPTLTLNDGGTATYTGGSGSSALTFIYTVAAGQNTADLAVTTVNLNSATVKDGTGNAANLSGAMTNPAGTLQIDTAPATVSTLTASGQGITGGVGNLVAGSVVTLTLNMNEAVTVAGGTPTLTLNDGGTATYTGGTGTNALTFGYTVAAGQNTADLAVTGVNMNAATVKDGAGMNANLSGAMTNPAGALQVNTTTATGAPTLTSIVQTPSGGDLNAGDTVTLTLNLNQAVTVAGGTPTLTLNDGGIATYTGSMGGQTYSDGSAGAPSGAPQVPNLLNGYAARAPWKVAGVDYAVGPNPGITLKDPTTINMAGVSLNTSAHTVTISGSNIVLDGYNFGNWNVVVTGANDGVKDSTFQVASGQTTVPIQGTRSASNLYVGYNIIDGGGTSGAVSNDNTPQGSLVTMDGSGLTFLYNWLKNAGTDMVGVGGGGTITYEYNLLQNGGMVTQHSDYLQLGTGTYTVNADFNTSYQGPTAYGSQGLMLEENGAVIAGGSVSNNTMIAEGEATTSTISLVSTIPSSREQLQ